MKRAALFLISLAVACDGSPECRSGETRCASPTRAEDCTHERWTLHETCAAGDVCSVPAGAQEDAGTAAPHYCLPQLDGGAGDQ